MSIPRNPAVFNKNICVKADYKESAIVPRKINHKTAPTHLTSPQVVTINKNFLLALINPTDDLSIQSRGYFNGFGIVSVSCFKPERVYMDAYIKAHFFGDTGLEDVNLKHLPTLSEFKILMTMLHYAQAERSIALEFDSVADMVRNMGLSTTAYNYNQVIYTLVNFGSLIMSYEECYKNQASNGQGSTKKKRSLLGSLRISLEQLNFFVVERVSLKQDKILVEFSTRFLQECATGWVQNLHIEKLNKIKSPKTMQLYLWLLEWCDPRPDESFVYSRRQYPILCDFLFSQLGWKKPDEDSVWLRPGRMLQQVKKCLDEIKEVDLGFKNFQVTLEDNKTKFFFKKLCLQKRPITSNV